MEFKTETRIVSISLRLWRGGWDAGYEPDCVADMDNGGFAREWGKGFDDGAIIASDMDVDSYIRWWQNDCRDANNGEDGDTLVALTEEERDRGDEWVFDYDEEPLPEEADE